MSANSVAGVVPDPGRRHRGRCRLL